jgi:cyclopropane-fatty-acyl-phospholipid synthase
MKGAVMHAPLRNRGSRTAGERTGIGPGVGVLSLFSGIFHRMLDRLDAGMERGSLDTRLPDGTRRLLGGRTDGPAAELEIASWRALVRLATGGSSGWYDAWAAGEWASPDPVALFELFGFNRATIAKAARARGFPLLLKQLTHRARRNHREGSRRNIRFHYDLGNDFYAAWLDPSMTYSSGIFAPGRTLEEAQGAKLAAMLERTGTAAGDSILEIGCGWGSFAEMAGQAGRRLHGITLSSEQKAWAEARIAAAGIAGVDFGLTDYRDVRGTYDAVVSIEMVEAVGREYWPAYLGTVADRLKPGGRAAIQYITFDDALFEGYAGNVDFIQTYIFPGGLLIRESEFRAVAEAKGLKWHDRPGFGPSYAETLKQWRERFETARLPAQFDRAFIDLWRYYLMYCEGGFRGGGIDVAQVTLVKEG